MYRNGAEWARLEDLAALLEVDDVACTAVRTGDQGEVIPVIMIKGPPGSGLERPEVAFAVGLVDTEEGPVVVLVTILPYHGASFDREYRCYMPMHASYMRDFLGLMTNTREWNILLFAGDVLTAELDFTLPDETLAELRRVESVVLRIPMNEGANWAAAKALAHMVMEESWRRHGPIAVSRAA